LNQYAASSIQRARLSTTLSAGLLYPASNAIDGDIDTRSVTRKRQGNWISVELPESTAVQYVALYNRVDLKGSWPAQLGTFEVWVSSAAGDTASSSAVMCGTASYRNPVDSWRHARLDSEPYVVDCSGVYGQFVTVKQVGPSRILVVAELKVYT
jgi:hypothetical protein